MSEDNEEKELSFEELLNQSEAKRVHRIHTGQKLSGTVVMISSDRAYIDIGQRSEAILPLPEDEQPSALEEGTKIDVFVVKPSGQVTLSLEPVMGYGDFSVVQDAFEAKTAVEGKVARVIPGGYEVSVAGVRCFCPHSQIDLRSVRNPEDMAGQTLPFRVIELDPGSNNVVLSRRLLLEEALREKLAKTREKLVPGNVLAGVVADIQPFGAFVDVGGIQGLVHISELAYHQVPTVEDVLQVGQEVDVKVLDVQQRRGKERISLSIKALLPDPWDQLGFVEGELVEGKVARKSKYGVFITVAEGIDGLLPKRMMKQGGQPVDMDHFEESAAIEVEVVEIDREGRKIALALPGWNEEARSSIQPGDVLLAEVIKVLPVGILVRGVDDPAKGLIHKRTLKAGSAKQITDMFPPGKQVEVVLEELDHQGRYNFVLKDERHGVDSEVMNRFLDDDEDLGHNPFANFFNQ